jgi:uncharacterized membrane protein
MKQSRLDQLSDGIFAIVLTILVFEIRVPDLGAVVTNQDIYNALYTMTPLFLSYLLSFTLLFTYWRAHHFIASVYAKNIDVKLTNINAVFFLFVALIPFSSQLLGKYHNTQAAVLIFATNVILIGLSLFWMRHYAHHSDTIENQKETAIAHRHAGFRIMFPVGCAFLASFFL